VELWTDGTMVVHACDRAGAIRVLRAGDLVAEIEVPLWREPPLAVDPAADRVWTGTGTTLREFRLSDLMPVADYPVPVSRIAALGRGRIAIVQDADQGQLLAVGRPERWEQQKKVEWIRGEPTLTYTKHGLIVADGQAGFVVHHDADLNRICGWRFDSSRDLELIGYATGCGVLVTSRRAARDSQVGWCTDDGRVSFARDGLNGAFAIPAYGDRFWLYDSLFGPPASLVNRAGETIAAHHTRFPFSALAAHGSGSTFAVADAAHVYIIRVDGDTLTVDPQTVPGLVEVSATYPAGAASGSDPDLMMKLRSHTLYNGMHGGRDADDRRMVWVVEVPSKHATAVADILRADGAVEVAVHDTDACWQSKWTPPAGTEVEG
jgi:hypothetical protein